MTKWKSAAYMDTMQELIPFTAGDIVKLPCLLIYMKLTAHIITAFLPVSTKSLKRAKEKKNRYKEVNICNTGRVFSNQTSLPVLYCLYFNKLVLVV